MSGGFILSKIMMTLEETLMESVLTPEQALSLARVVPFDFPAAVLVDYDRGADVLYISFARPQQATGYGHDG